MHLVARQLLQFLYKSGTTLALVQYMDPHKVEYVAFQEPVREIQLFQPVVHNRKIINQTKDGRIYRVIALL